MQYYFRHFGILIIIILVIGLLFFNIPKMKRLYKIRKRLLTESDYVKKRKLDVFKEINYDTPYRKKYYNYILIAFGISLLAFLLSWLVLMKSNDHSIIVLFIFLGCGYFIYKIISDYKKGFKDNVLEPIIEAYNKQVDYSGTGGLSKEEYKNLNFPERYNKFSSSDLFYNREKNIAISNILVENDTSDTDNNVGIELVYEGSLAMCNINNIHSKILIGNIKQLLAMDDKDKVIKLDNDMFNKCYLISTSNEVLTRNLLRDDLVSRLVNLKKYLHGDIDIRIFDDKLYVRFNCADGFRPNLLSKRMEMNSILTTIIVFDEISTLCEIIKNKLENPNNNYEVL